MCQNDISVSQRSTLETKPALLLRLYPSSRPFILLFLPIRNKLHTIIITEMLQSVVESLQPKGTCGTILYGAHSLWPASASLTLLPSFCHAPN